MPSAAALAAEAKRKYDATYGPPRPPLPAGIEEQAEFFLQRGQLATVYFRKLVDADAFSGPPNPGHSAIADLLLVHAIQAAVTTNVDCLIETAGQLLLGQVGKQFRRDGCRSASTRYLAAPKIHGCRTRDPDNMIWCRGQLEMEPIAGRIASSEEWLRAHLRDRDLVVIGYWTDWDYLNSVLERVVGSVRPACCMDHLSTLLTMSPLLRRRPLLPRWGSGRELDFNMSELLAPSFSRDFG